jgi:hypothetical protein
MANGTQVEIQPYALEAYVQGLAYRLALSWAPDKVPMLKPLADEAYNDFVDQNVETANQYISPQIGGYFR